MPEHVPSLLAAWESFYVIVGSSAAALTGLQFVVIVLSAEVNVLGGSSTTAAFATPTIVHFSTVLLISAVLSAPWPDIADAGVILGMCGTAGVIYGLTVIHHARKQTAYTPVLEDIVWHWILPIVAYATLLGSAIAVGRHPVMSLFLVAGTSLLLLFVGIHNAWDSVIYIAQTGRRQADKGDQERNGSNPS